MSYRRCTLNIQLGRSMNIWVLSSMDTNRVKWDNVADVVMLNYDAMFKEIQFTWVHLEMDTREGCHWGKAKSNNKSPHCASARPMSLQEARGWTCNWNAYYCLVKGLKLVIIPIWIFHWQRLNWLLNGHKLLIGFWVHCAECRRCCSRLIIKWTIGTWFEQGIISCVVLCWTAKQIDWLTDWYDGPPTPP